MDELARTSRDAAVAVLPPDRHRPPDGDVRQPARGRLHGRLRLRELTPVAAAALAAAVWLVLAPDTADLAAHSYRAWLWETDGFAVYNAQWYGGHHVPGYSLLFPPLAAAVGVRVAVALCGVAAALSLVALARDADRGRRGELAAWLLAAGAASNVVVGRGPFVLGVALGASALLLVRRERYAGAALAAALCAAASPVAGAFLALAALATVRVQKGPGPLCTLVPPVAVVAALALLFPEGGAERFVSTAFWPLAALCVGAALLIEPDRRALRVGAALYVLALIAAFLVETPMGQNAARLGVLAGPAVLALAGRGPRAALLAVGAGLVYLQWLPAVRAVAEARDDPAAKAAFHEPLLGFLDRAAAPADRVEVVFTRNHWEALHVARRYALGRGWERQLDLERNGLFYADGPLSPRAYEAWLRREGIRWVAVPDAPLDFSAREEAALVRGGAPFLRPAFAGGGWRVFEVAGVAPATARATPTSIEVRATRPGRHVVRRRFTRYWRITAGRGCVRQAPGGWTAVDAEGPGLIRIQARLTGRRCR